MSGTSDRELIQWFQQGDTKALGKLYDRYQDDVYKFILARVSGQQLAEDLTGEVFTKVVVYLPDSDIRNFRAWLFRITRNHLIDFYRSKEETAMVSVDNIDVHAAADNPAAAAEQQLMLEHVQHALNALEATQRDVVILRFLVGLSLKEVADTLNKSVGAVKALQHRGLNNLRHLLAYVEE